MLLPLLFGRKTIRFTDSRSFGQTRHTANAIVGSCRSMLIVFLRSES